MVINQLDRDALVTAAYQAGTDPSRWSNLIELLDKKLDSVYLSLYGHDTTTGIFPDSLTSKYSDEFIETIRFIAPHIKRAFEIQRALAGQSLNSTAYQAELNRLEHAVFLIDSNGLPTHWNSTAEEIVRSGELCTLQRSSPLKFFDLGAENGFSLPWRAFV